MAAVIMMVLAMVSMMLKLLVMELLLLLLLKVMLLLKKLVVVEQSLRVASDSSNSSGSAVVATVQRLLNQSSCVLSSLLLTAAARSEVRLRWVIVSWVDHSQDPHFQLLLIVIWVAVKLGFLLHLLSLILVWRVQVCNQSVTTLGSLGVGNSLSLSSILDSRSERTRALTLEVDGLRLRRVDNNLTLLLLVQYSLDVFHKLLFGGESLDDITLGMSRNKETTVFKLHRRRLELVLLNVLLLLQMVLRNVVLLLQRMVHLLLVKLRMVVVMQLVLVVQLLLLQLLLLLL